MLSATIPAKYGHKWINPESLINESWPDGRANCTIGQQGYVFSANPFTDNPKLYGQVSVDHPYQDKPIGPSYAHYDINGHGFIFVEPTAAQCSQAI